MLIEKYKDQIEKTLGKYPDRRSAVMPMLYLAQQEYGHITPEAMAEVAEICEMSVTQVRSLVGFYTMYYEKPKGKYLIQVCTDLPCALRGAEQFFEALKDYLGVEEGEVTPDGLFSIEQVMCLAACDKAPVMQINFSYCEGLDIDKAKAIIDDLRAGKSYTPAYRWRAAEHAHAGRKQGGKSKAEPEA
ncbi:MAG: NAD(P)H-dependent oxidoreductase subunit E [Anaerolineae bacterium]|nr:NAD(P)H-dependent oxidoreductase subunit E [Anaerolineae bacterium]